MLHSENGGQGGGGCLFCICVTSKFERQEPQPSRSPLLWGDSPELCVGKLEIFTTTKILNTCSRCDLQCAKQSVTEGAFKTTSHHFLNFFLCFEFSLTRSKTCIFLVYDLIIISNHIVLCSPCRRNKKEEKVL